MTRQILFIWVAILGAFLTKNATAQNIAVIDLQRAVNESQSGKEARAIVESQVKKDESKLLLLQEEMKKLQKDYEKQSSLLSGQALEEKQDQLRKKDREYQTAYEDQRRSLEKKNQKEIGEVVQRVDQVVKGMAKKEGYQFILEKDPRFVVYSSPRIDLTEKVVAVLDE